jgi:hypothetical protein
MGYLEQLNIASKDNKATKLFEQVLLNPFVSQEKPAHQFIKDVWKSYKNEGDYDGSINGKVFEYLLAIVLIREQILPFYQQASVAFVPNVVYDFLLYSTKNFPISVSAKTSLRERYKQADLEAVALKNVHRKAKSYLVTLDEKEASAVKQKVSQVDVMGIDDVYVADQPEFDDFITSLREHSYRIAPTVPTIKSNFLVSAELVDPIRNKNI